MGVPAIKWERYTFPAVLEGRGENAHPSYCQKHGPCTEMKCPYCGRIVCSFYPWNCVCKCSNEVESILAPGKLWRCGGRPGIDCDCENSTAEVFK